jgi:HK97 family phage major capsid protein
MKSAKALADEIQALQAKVQAIQAIATQETRELLEDEQAEIDTILGTEGKPGQIENLAKQRERAIKIEQAVSNTVRQHVDSQPLAGATFRVPATARATKPLAVFTGPDGEAEAFRVGKFFQAHFGSESAKQWCRDHGVQNTLQTNDPTGAGVLVPPEFVAGVIRLVFEYGVIPRYAFVRNMTSDTLTTSRRLTGMRAYPVGESKEFTQSQATYGPLNLVARKWGTLTKVSSELSEDSTISMAEEIATEAALAHALAADEAGFLGDGTGAYHGVVGLANALAAGSVVTAAAGQNTAATITIAMFENAVGKLPEFRGIRPAWFVHKSTWSTVMGRLQIAAGGNNKEDIGQGPSANQFLGYPVVFSEVLPKTIGASTKFGYFGDLRMASTLGLRRNFELVGDASRYFETDEIGFRSTMRWDYNVHERGDASNPGPILQLVSAS